MILEVEAKRKGEEKKVNRRVAKRESSRYSFQRADVETICSR